ncbi:MAG TPA: hypothetical protein VLU38_05150, partial [Methanomassiliicoccales archaeon]|nr:hypothetical protein [Methanomassiliicoccales archaeon]
MVDQVALLRPVPPYDFELSARIFADGDESFRSYKDGTFSHVIRGSRGLALCRVSSTGSVDSPELRLSTQLDRGGRSGAGEMVGKVRTLLNLDLDLRPFYKMAAKDRVLSTLTHGLRGLKSPTTGTVFEALID